MHVFERALADPIRRRIAQQPLGRLAEEQDFSRRVHEDDGVGAVFDQRLEQVAGRRLGFGHFDVVIRRIREVVIV